ncbi:GAF domain-containing sensor histidine kinase [Spirulina major]|uniref:sensor histidine kinase n=1 Tax=Spirulina major TaxID=270636 RepID=UPI000932CD88|nr:GAF domain-containing sensor histidine kinase [Spirulina major]
MLIPASPEFIQLCQAQVTLLAQSLHATWCAVYLTENWIDGLQPQLHPVAEYPSASSASTPSAPLAIAPSAPDPSPSNVAPTPEPSTQPPPVIEPDLSRSTPWQDSVLWGRRQVIFPLLHQGLVMGLLVARRETQAWQTAELGQFKQGAQALAIACFLDQQHGQAQQKLTHHYHQLQQQRDRLDDLLHQLRNPMTALRTFSKLLLKRLLPEDRNYPVAENMLRESDHIQALLRQFDQWLAAWESPPPVLTGSPQPYLLPSHRAGASEQNSSHSVSPPTTLHYEAVPLSSFLVPLVESAQAIAAERQITIDVDPPDLWPAVWVDAAALREVVGNLLDNAVKYTPDGGQVRVRMQGNAEQCGIAIADTGVGIPPADQNRIFDRRYRGIQAQGEIPGTGLGLAIAQELTAQMQGHIELQSPIYSDPDAPGTCFTLWLPL